MHFLSVAEHTWKEAELCKQFSSHPCTKFGCPKQKIYRFYWQNSCLKIRYLSIQITVYILLHHCLPAIGYLHQTCT